MRPVSRWFVALMWGMAILFSLCVGLQVNDPDPVRWMAIYGAAALAAAALPIGRLFAAPAALVGMIAGAWAGYLTAQVFDVLEFSDLFTKMSEKGGAVEVGREAGGLVLVSATLLGGAAFRATRA